MEGQLSERRLDAFGSQKDEPICQLFHLAEPGGGGKDQGVQPQRPDWYESKRNVVCVLSAGGHIGGNLSSTPIGSTVYAF